MAVNGRKHMVPPLPPEIGPSQKAPAGEQGRAGRKVGSGKGGDTITSGLEAPWPKPTKWTTGLDTSITMTMS